jgi:hypothetical protein
MMRELPGFDRDPIFGEILRNTLLLRRHNSKVPSRKWPKRLAVNSAAVKNSFLMEIRDKGKTL